MNHLGLNCYIYIQCYITWAPWRTRTSIPLLSIEMRAASSTSDSEDSSSLSGFEKMAFSSYHNFFYKKGKSKSQLQFTKRQQSRGKLLLNLKKEPWGCALHHRRRSYQAVKPHTLWHQPMRRCQTLQWNIYHCQYSDLSIELISRLGGMS